MAARTDIFDLAGLRLTSGAGRRLELAAALGEFELSGEHYEPVPPVVPVTLGVSRTTGNGYALHLRFSAALKGPCMRCLGDAEPTYEIDAREVSLPGEGEELESPYLTGTPPSELDLSAWAHDALALVLPTQILCRPDCLGLCPECGVDLNTAGPEHGHERAPDPRWAKLSELHLDGAED